MPRILNKLQIEPFVDNGQVMWKLSQKNELGEKIELGVTRSSPPPAYHAMKELRNILKVQGSIYDLTHKMVVIDPEIHGAVNAIALQVEKSFNGLKLRRPENGDADERDKKLQNILDLVYKNMQLSHLAGNIAFSCIRDGDHVINKSVLINSRPMPMRYVTAVERRSDIGINMRPCFTPNYYVINEQGLMEMETSSFMLSKRRQSELKLGVPIARHNVIHFPMNNHDQIVIDNVGRWTHGVWSIPPLAPLKTMFVGKVNLLGDDMAWRHASVPRKHHKLDMASHQLGLFEGTGQEGRYAMVKSAQKEELKNYIKSIRWKEADEDYVTSDNITIEVLEPKSTSYAAPNDMLSQMIDSVTAGLGVTRGALLGNTGASFASELVLMSFAALKAEAIAEMISHNLLQMILPIVVRVMEIDSFIEGTKDQKAIENAEIADIQLAEDYRLLDRIYFDIRLVYGEAQSRLIRDATLMTDLGVFTEAEVRDRAGYHPLTEDQRAFIVDKSKAGMSGSKVGSDNAQKIDPTDPMGLKNGPGPGGAQPGAHNKTPAGTAADSKRRQDRPDTDRPKTDRQKAKSQST